MHIDGQVSLRERGADRQRGWFLAYVGFVGVYTLAVAVVMTRGVSPFVTGDWLINYSGGFVRRGLVGAFGAGIESCDGLACGVDRVGP